MNTLIKTIFFFLSVTVAVTAQKEKQASTFSIVLNQDNAFGFYPYIQGSFGINAKSSFTFYGILWTNPGFAQGITPNPQLGSDLWLEAGAGYSFNTLNDKLFLNPSLGLTHGKLLSGGTTKVAEGIVPSLFALFNDGTWEMEFFSAYYQYLRNGPANSSYFLGWIYPGYIVNKNVSLGVHLENFSSFAGGASTTLYQWVGGYVKFTVADRYTFRLSAGGNTISQNYYSKEYYKLTSVIPLQR